MADYTPTEQFVRCLTEYQSRLYAYILTMLGDPDAAGDVLQDANVAICARPRSSPRGTDFWAWTSRIAHFEALAYRKCRRRDRLVFDDPLIESLAVEAVRAGPMEADLAALVRCMERLSQLDQELVRGRYCAGRVGPTAGPTAGQVGRRRSRRPSTASAPNWPTASSRR